MIREGDRNKILSSIPEDATVLDVGAASNPLGRANWVLDVQAYRKYTSAETRDGLEPRFTKDTWICRDACEKEPWPLADKSVDFAICSHTLEDVRDPIWICRELSRVAKAGYVEIPSREWESTRGVELRFELPRQAGLYHHRWLCELRDERLLFTMKPGFMHASSMYSFPHRMLKHWKSVDRLVLRIEWQDDLPAEEYIHDDFRRFQADMREYVTRHTGKTLRMLFYDHFFRPCQALANIARAKARKS